MRLFGRKEHKDEKSKPVKLCGEDSHDWNEVTKVKDGLGRHPCKYHPEGCNTCLTRFECYTKDNDTYRDRISGIVYACSKCPALKVDGKISSWDTHNYHSILDCREQYFIFMDKATIKKLSDKWKGK